MALMGSKIPNREQIYNWFILPNYFFKFISEGASGLIMYIYVKFFIDSIVITTSLVFPKYAY